MPCVFPYCNENPNTSKKEGCVKAPCKGISSTPPLRVALTGYKLVAAAIVWSGQLNGAGRIIWAVVFAMAIVAVSSLRIAWIQRGPLRRLGQVSFSLYLLHPLVIFIFDRKHVPDWFVATLTVSTPTAWAAYSVLIVALVWGFSELTYRLVEGPGIRLGEAIVSKVRRGLPASPASGLAASRQPMPYFVESEPDPADSFDGLWRDRPTVL